MSNSRFSVTLATAVIEEGTDTHDEGIVEYYEDPDEFKSVDLLMLDDFPAESISVQKAIDLLEIIEVREGLRSTAVASQLDPDERYTFAPRARPWPTRSSTASRRGDRTST